MADSEERSSCDPSPADGFVLEGKWLKDLVQPPDEATRRAALNRLVDQLYPAIVVNINRTAGSLQPATRDDLLQETWVAIIKFLNRCDASRSFKMSFFTTIARNVVRRGGYGGRGRERTDMQGYLDLVEGHEESMKIEQKEALDAVLRARNSLEPDDQEILELLVDESLTLKEECDKLGLSHKTVRKREARAVRRLRDAWLRELKPNDM